MYKCIGVITLYDYAESVIHGIRRLADKPTCLNDFLAMAPYIAQLGCFFYSCDLP